MTDALIEDLGVSRQPSFEAGSAAECSKSRSVRAAFCFAGHVRTLLHPEAQHSLLHHGVLSFGAAADTFFYLTNDDTGTTSGHRATSDPEQAVRLAIKTFRPKALYYGPFLNASPPRLPDRCALPVGWQGHHFGAIHLARPMWHRVWETWEKLARSFRMSVEYEQRHDFLYDWVVRLRTDLWFFGRPVAHCSLNASGLIFSSGVVGCANSAVCSNDHLVYAPRHLAPEYFETAVDIEQCRFSARNRPAELSTYYWWRMLNRSLPIVPSVPVPYTLLRPCSANVNQPNALKDSHGAVTPDCWRWRATRAIHTSWPDPLALDVMRAHFSWCTTRWAVAAAAPRNANLTCAASDTVAPKTTWAFPV